MPVIALLLLFFIASANAAERELVYHLLSDRRNTDLNYSLLERLQQQERRATDAMLAGMAPLKGYTMLVSASDLEPLFRKSVAGRYRVLTFCALEVGRHPEPINRRLDFIAHHLLVLKIGPDNRILDGFYFIREWAEAPMLYMLLRFHSTERRITKDFRLTSADFLQLGGDAPKHFNPTGRLDNLLNFKEVF